MRFGIVYHRIDFDGIMSYAVVRKYLEEHHPGCSIVPLPYNHGDGCPALDGFNQVYVVDIALPPQKMQELFSARCLVWVDHHVTSIEESHLYGYAASFGLRAVGKGACELAWDFLYPEQPAPGVVQRLSVYDVFDKRRPGLHWEEDILPFQWGMRRRYGLDAERLSRDYAFGVFDPPSMRRIRQEGRAILDYVRDNGSKSAHSYGFEVAVGEAGHKVLAILTDSFGSIPYEEEAASRGCSAVMCINRHGDDDYKLSIYSVVDKPVFHIGDYLKRAYGGGGHEGAGGCLISKDAFLRILSEKVF